MNIPTFNEIRQAANRIAPHAHRTPVLTCSTLNDICDAEVFFKCENFQKVGAFKFRGAANAVFSLTEEEANPGVATHSSGNHAAALTLAAKLRGIPAYVVMPDNAPDIKKRAVAGYGAEIIYCPPTLEARESHLAAIVERTGATFIPPYDDARIIAGQGTAASELCEDVPQLDVVLAPVGGGGLLAGSAIATNALNPAAKIIAAEPTGADDAARSFESGSIVPSTNPNTIADGLLTSLGELNFAVIQERVDAILTVTDEQIIAAMRTIWERMKIIIEPSAAVPVASLIARRNDIPGQRIGVILSGGNVDLGKLPW